jgi:hypothetical protein
MHSRCDKHMKCQCLWCYAQVLVTVTLGVLQLGPNDTLPKKPEQLAGLVPSTGSLGPVIPTILSLITCTQTLPTTQWTSLCGLIKLYRRGMAGTDYAGELRRLDSWLDQLHAPKTPTRTSTWLLKAPHPRLTLHQNPISAGKPLRRFLCHGYYVT